MKNILRNTNVPIAIIYLWIGFVCAISFMEAWLKFRATGVTLSVGLSIGSLIFFALNKVEIIFALIVLLHWFTLKANSTNAQYLWVLFVPIAILLLQTTYLLPVLDERVKMIMQHKTVPPSNTHIYYVLAEIAKVATLFWTGSKAFKTLKINHK